MNKSIVSNLSLALRDMEGLEVLLRVGLKRDSVKGKTDLLAGCIGEDMYKYISSVETLLKNRWPTENFFVSDDSVRFELPTETGGVAICNSTMLVSQIEGWIDGKNLGGQHRSWAIGYWLPEALCGDLATAEILYDAKNIGVQIKELTVPYPSALSCSIIDFCEDEINQKIQMLEWLSKKNTPIEFGLCISDLSTSMVRLAFARSHRYLRGFKSLEEQTKFLRSQDLPIYDLALELLKKKRVSDLVDKIERLL